MPRPKGSAPPARFPARGPVAEGAGHAKGQPPFHGHSKLFSRMRTSLRRSGGGTEGSL